MPKLTKKAELDLELALKALRNIVTYTGIVCDECGEGGITHPECLSSQRAWTIAVTALDKIRLAQSGEYAEYQLSKYKGRE